MSIYDIGRLCVKLMGREAGKYCVIVEIIDKNYLLIDGCHDLTAVICDFVRFYRKVKRGGRIAFHDYIKGNSVYNAVQLIQNEYALKELGKTKKLGLIVFEKL